MTSKECLPDVQCTEPNIQIPIMQVGVENVEVPFKLETKGHSGFNQMIANVSLRTNLDSDTKGISLSLIHISEPTRPY